MEDQGFKQAAPDLAFCKEVREKFGFGVETWVHSALARPDRAFIPLDDDGNPLPVNPALLSALRQMAEKYGVRF